MTAGLVFEAIYGLVAPVTGLTGGCHRDRAPKDTAFPYAIMSVETPEVSDVLSGEAYFTGDWTVKVVDKSDSAKVADDLYLLVHAALQNVTLTLTGHTSMVCRRRGFFSYDEDLEGGERAQHVGGVYRVMADPT